jgi:hypothetical protein
VLAARPSHLLTGREADGRDGVVAGVVPPTVDILMNELRVEGLIAAAERRRPVTT